MSSLSWDQKYNSSCDGQGGDLPCSLGEVRVLPLNSGSNLILCRKCYEKEIEYRKGLNRRLSERERWALPAWDDLEIYDAGE